MDPIWGPDPVALARPSASGTQDGCVLVLLGHADDRRDNGTRGDSHACWGGVEGCPAVSFGFKPETGFVLGAVG